MPNMRNGPPGLPKGDSKGGSAPQRFDTRDLIKIALNAAQQLAFPGPLVRPGWKKNASSDPELDEAYGQIAMEKRHNLKAANRALAALIRLEEARMLSLSVRLIFFKFRVITWPLMGAMVWRLFYLKEARNDVFQRILEFDVFTY